MSRKRERKSEVQVIVLCSQVERRWFIITTAKNLVQLCSCSSFMWKARPSRDGIRCPAEQIPQAVLDYSGSSPHCRVQRLETILSFSERNFELIQVCPTHSPESQAKHSYALSRTPKIIFRYCVHSSPPYLFEAGSLTGWALTVPASVTDQQASGIFLSPAPQCGNCRLELPHSAFDLGTESLNSGTLVGTLSTLLFKNPFSIAQNSTEWRNDHCL